MLSRKGPKFGFFMDFKVKAHYLISEDMKTFPTKSDHLHFIASSLQAQKMPLDCLFGAVMSSTLRNALMLCLEHAKIKENWKKFLPFFGLERKWEGKKIKLSSGNSIFSFAFSSPIFFCFPFLRKPKISDIKRD